MAMSPEVQGLQPGAVVAADSFNRLSDGAKVTIRPSASDRETHHGLTSNVNPSRPFILRPVATSLLMAALLLSGAIAYRQLGISALPEVDYPTIQVAHLLSRRKSRRQQLRPLPRHSERQFGQMPGLNQMTSVSSDGSSIITLQFALNLNIDVAEQEVQAAINAAQTFYRPICQRRPSTANRIRLMRQ